MKIITAIILLAISFAASADINLNRVYLFEVSDTAANYGRSTIRDTQVITLDAPASIRATATTKPINGADGLFDGDMESVEITDEFGGNSYSASATFPNKEKVSVLFPVTFPAGKYLITTQLYCSGINRFTGACGSRYSLQIKTK